MGQFAKGIIPLPMRNGSQKRTVETTTRLSRDRLDPRQRLRVPAGTWSPTIFPPLRGGGQEHQIRSADRGFGLGALLTQESDQVLNEGAVGLACQDTDPSPLPWRLPDDLALIRVVEGEWCRDVVTRLAQSSRTTHPHPPPTPCQLTLLSPSSQTPRLPHSAAPQHRVSEHPENRQRATLTASRRVLKTSAGSKGPYAPLRDCPGGLEAFCATHPTPET